MPPRCGVCRRADRDAIDAELIMGVPASKIAPKYNLHPATVRRHARNHVPLVLAEADDRINDVVWSLLEEARATIAESKTTADPRLKLAAMREARETAKLLIEIARIPDTETEETACQ